MLEIGWIKLTAQKSLDIFESYNRFYNGKKVREDTWDYVTIPTNALAMKEKYNIEFTDDIIPEDEDLCDRLFLAGVDMLVSTGFYNTDMGRALSITEDEVYEGIKKAPKELVFGSGKDQRVCRKRFGNDDGFKPLIEGGPTGAPVSENIFIPMMRSYAQESTVDLLVSGVLSSVDGIPSTTNTPWEIRATLAEVRYVREASLMANRPGLGI